jgi:general secretion pathway protein G
MTAEPRTTPREQGFTFLEIMVVVIIIGMLTTLIANNIFGRFGQAKHELARSQLQKVEQALEFYKLDNGNYPTTEQGLEALVREPTSEPRPRRWLSGGYLKEGDLRDPWDHPFRYEVPGQHNGHSFDLYSLGEDGAEGGTGNNADVANWDTST